MKTFFSSCLLLVLFLAGIPRVAMATDCNAKVEVKEYRGEPQYVGLTGYAVPIDNPDDYSQRLPKQPWKVPLLKQVGADLWEKGRKTIPAKTEVIVERQEMSHTGHGYYKGILFVKNKKTEKEYVIDHRSFVPTDYWNCPPDKAVEYSFFLAKVVGPVQPIATRSKGRWGEMGKEKTVFCHGKPDNDDKKYAQNGVVCEVYKKYRYGYGGIGHIFPADSLRIIY